MTFTDRNEDFQDHVDHQVVRDALGPHLFVVTVVPILFGLGAGLLLWDVLAGFITYLVFTLVWMQSRLDEGLPALSPYNPFEDLSPNDPIGTNPHGPRYDKENQE